MRVVSYFVFFKQKTAYEMRISDWSSDVCSSDLGEGRRIAGGVDILDDDAVSPALLGRVERRIGVTVELLERARAARLDGADAGGHRTIADRRAVIERRQRSEEHTSEL